MLDERGAEYTVDHGYREFFWEFGESGLARASAVGTKGLVQMILTGVTPEQAIAATLGAAYEPPVAAHWDGDVLTLTIPRDPSYIRVQRSTEQPCKVYADESRIIAAALGRGTCHANETECFECLDSRYRSFEYYPYITVHVMECSECGGTYEHVNGNYEFCPRCGRRIEVVDE